MKNDRAMSGVLISPFLDKQGIYLTNLVSLSMLTITALNDPLVGKPAMKAKVQKPNQLSGKGKGASSLEGRALTSLAC